MEDMDQDFLTRFSCMGTQDKDVLISELHSVLGSQLSREGCLFFLEMTNWYGYIAAMILVRLPSSERSRIVLLRWACWGMI